MPPNLVHCQVCRTLLNEELDQDSVEIPEFVPLRELEAMVESRPGGLYVACPACDRELRINRKYVGTKVACKFCSHGFGVSLLDPNVEVLAVYLECPHCHQELRAARKYVGTKVACKFCGGHIQIGENLQD